MVTSADGIDNPRGFTVSAGQTSHSTFSLERPGTWLVTVSPDAGAEGDYEVKIHRPDLLLNPVQLNVSSGSVPGSLSIQANVDTARQFTAIPIHIRFWVGEEGFVKALPVTSSTSFEWISVSNGIN